MTKTIESKIKKYEERVVRSMTRFDKEYFEAEENFVGYVNCLYDLGFITEDELQTVRNNFVLDNYETYLDLRF